MHLGACRKFSRETQLSGLGYIGAFLLTLIVCTFYRKVVFGFLEAFA